MPKIVTLRLDDEVYRKFKALADSDNRPMSNFIETAALRFVESEQFADEFEMQEIRSNQDLNKSLAKALRDVKAERGRHV